MAAKRAGERKQERSSTYGASPGQGKGESHSEAYPSTAEDQHRGEKERAQDLLEELKDAGGTKQQLAAMAAER